MRYTWGRWAFFPVSILIQMILYLVYPIGIIYYLFWIRPVYKKWVVYRQPKHPLKEIPNVELEKRIKALKELPNETRDIYFFNTNDNHNLLFHCHLFVDPLHGELTETALRLSLDKKTGAILRKYPNEHHNKVSNDCYAGWLLTWAMRYTWNWPMRKDAMRGMAMKAAWHFLKHCFGVKDAVDNAISDRCSCGGVNLVGDGWKGLSFPSVGVYFFTAMAQLAVAVKAAPWWQKPFWELIYHLYFWLFCGPWNALAANLHQAKDPRYYLMHVTAHQIYVLRKLRPWSLWWKISDWWIRKINHPHGIINPWFEALAHNAGSKIDVKYTRRLLMAIEWSDVFQWQKDPIYDWLIQKGPELYPASRTSVLYLLENQRGKTRA